MRLDRDEYHNRIGSLFWNVEDAPRLAEDAWIIPVHSPETYIDMLDTTLERCTSDEMRNDTKSAYRWIRDHLFEQVEGEGLVAREWLVASKQGRSKHSWEQVDAASIARTYNLPSWLVKEHGKHPALQEAVDEIVSAKRPFDRLQALEKAEAAVAYRLDTKGTGRVPEFRAPTRSGQGQGRNSPHLPLARCLVRRALVERMMGHISQQPVMDRLVHLTGYRPDRIAAIALDYTLQRPEHLPAQIRCPDAPILGRWHMGDLRAELEKLLHSHVRDMGKPSYENAHKRDFDRMLSFALGTATVCSMAFPTAQPSVVTEEGMSQQQTTKHSPPPAIAPGESRDTTHLRQPVIPVSHGPVSHGHADSLRKQAGKASLAGSGPGTR